jgi:TatD DNase family protein
LDAGWYVSFSGLVTFKRYDTPDQVRRVPDDRILVETDAPYLAPVPNRGKRNEPAWAMVTARRLAEIRGEPFDEFAARLEANARAFYRVDGAGR